MALAHGQHVRQQQTNQRKVRKHVDSEQLFDPRVAGVQDRVGLRDSGVVDQHGGSGVDLAQQAGDC